MNFRKYIVALIVALIAIPSSASAWWWKDRETLVDVAVDVNNQLGAFNILLDLATANKRVLWRLEYGRQTTVFAPTDTAFLDLLAIVAEEPFCYPSLESIPGWYVDDVLNYHLARGNQDSGDVFFGDGKVRMLFGGFLFPDADTLSLADNATTAGILDPAGIVQIPDVQTFDIAADNGVIHAIDRVLLPYLPPSNCE